MLTKQRFFLKPLTIIEIVTDDDMKLISLHPLPEFTVSKLIPIDIAQTGNPWAAPAGSVTSIAKTRTRMPPAARIEKTPVHFFLPAYVYRYRGHVTETAALRGQHNSSILVT